MVRLFTAGLRLLVNFRFLALVGMQRLRLHTKRASIANRARRCWAQRLVPTLVTAATAKILDLNEQGGGKAVIELQKIDIVGCEPRLGVSGATRLRRSRRRQIFRLADVFVGVPFTIAE